MGPSKFGLHKTFAHLDHPIRALSMSHDSKIIAYGSENGVIAFGCVESGAHLGGLDLGGGMIRFC